MTSDYSDNDEYSTSSDGIDSFVDQGEESPTKKATTEIAMVENKAVTLTKILVFGALLLAASTVTAVTYIFATTKESNEYQSSFAEFSRELLRSAETQLDNKLGAVASIATMYTSFAEFSHDEFPLITHPFFERNAEQALSLAEADFLLFAPVVKGEDLDAWGNYSVANQHWIKDGLEYQGISEAPVGIRSRITSVDGDVEHHMGIHVPVWQVIPAPLDTESINLDLYSEGALKASIDIVLEHNHVVISRTLNLSFLKSLQPNEMFSNEPRSLLISPVLGAFEENMGHGDQHSTVGEEMNTHDDHDMDTVIDHDTSIGMDTHVDHDTSTGMDTHVDHDTTTGMDTHADHDMSMGGNRRRKSQESTHNIMPDETMGMDAHADHEMSQTEEHDAHSTMPDSVKGFIIASLPWRAAFTGILSDGIEGLVVHIRDTCGSDFSYLVNGEDALYLGEGEFPELYDGKMSLSKKLSVISNEHAHMFEGDEELENEFCNYSLTVHPAREFTALYKTRDPLRYAIIVGVAFVFTTLVFLLYDFFVQRRQQKVLSAAQRSGAVVASLFPEQVQQRLLNEESDKPQNKRNLLNRKGSALNAVSPTKGIIADLFPEVTVLFADLVGFTAWSSTREPTQVFHLLETLYSAFDEIANRRRIFKVETVGDCYVAAAGLPEARADHAVAMVRFTRDIIAKMKYLVNELEVELGPDTADLGVRVGIHSGPVTAGVLRGDRARFQLFGDTMNVTARLESLGKMNQIHISEQTANLLIAAGKKHWTVSRPDKVTAKGKGQLNTFFVPVEDKNLASSNHSSSNLDQSSSEDVGQDPISTGKIASSSEQRDEKHERLVAWNSEILFRLLEDVNNHRLQTGSKVSSDDELTKLETQISTRSQTLIEEVEEIVHLPGYSSKSEGEKLVLGESVRLELEEYVRTLAAMYRKNPFHNFEHASHVTMSVTKLLSRIVAPASAQKNDHSVVHDTTYGITSDPLTQFAVVLSALIHDVDHPGVPNTQLVNEQANIAVAYKGRSVAEQNSIDLSWDLLIDDSFKNLRRAIYKNSEELTRFRQLVVNTVMATDIMDKDLKSLRNAKWQKAFDGSHTDDSVQDTINRKATIVIEHLIQASDVAHTMQHWHIYRKWNQRLFEEMYVAFEQGRAAKNPVDFWYEGEIGFFDFYIIPLAKKLKECGVFGVSSDEYLNYAMMNRQEWEQRGKEVVAELIEGVQYAKKEKMQVSVKPPPIKGTPRRKSLSADQA